MRKLLLLIMTMLILMCNVVFAKEYRNDKYGLTMTFPEHWQEITARSPYEMFAIDSETKTSGSGILAISEPNFTISWNTTDIEKQAIDNFIQYFKKQYIQTNGNKIVFQKPMIIELNGIRYLRLLIVDKNRTPVLKRFICHPEDNAVICVLTFLPLCVTDQELTDVLIVDNSIRFSK